MTDCVRYAPMIDARAGELSPEERAGLEAHLAGCAGCRARAAAQRVVAGLLSEALLAQANRRDFGPFVDGVMARIERRRAPRGVLARLRAAVVHHPRITFGAALAPVLAALAILVYVRTTHDEVARVLELNSEGVDMVVQTSDGPLVLMGAEDDPEGT